MSFELVKKIVNEVSSEGFRQKHNIKTFILGENGDAFLNPDIIRILRYIKSKLPEVKIILFTDFQYFSKDKAQIILGGRLINYFYCNIDGSNERNYFLVKKPDFKVVTKNLIDFLEVRRELKNESKLNIIVLTLNHYIKTIRKNFGFYPVKLQGLKYTNIPDDFSIIKKQWKKLLDSEKDKIYKSVIIGWAERDNVNYQDIDYQKYSCPNLLRLKQEAFIAPDGTWYACCFDSNNELVLGNVMIESIDKIYSGQIRINLVERLEKKEFDKINGPCRTVNCCQAIGEQNPLKLLLKKLLGERFVSTITKLKLYSYLRELI